MQKLGMREGFDVGLEMSGNPKAFADIADMIHGGKIAMLGIMPGSAAIDWNMVVFNGLTIKGVYGREMVLDLVQNDGYDSEGPGYFSRHHPPLSVTEFKEAIQVDEIRTCSCSRLGRTRSDGLRAIRTVADGCGPSISDGYRSVAPYFCRPSNSSTIRLMCR